MTTETTQSRLKGMQRNVENFDPKEWCEGVTLEGLRNDYEAYKEVANTLTFHEMRLIAVLRGCRLGETRRFLTAAEQLYAALQNFAALGEITLPKWSN